VVLQVYLLVEHKIEFRRWITLDPQRIGDFASTPVNSRNFLRL